MEFISNSVEDTKKYAAEFLQKLKSGDVVCLSGDLGAGKTQFVQGIASALGVNIPVVSPTFNILLEYRDGKIPLFHFDLYRLTDEEELEDIAFYETIESDGLSFIEWSEKFPDAMPSDAYSVNIEKINESIRKITISKGL